MFVSSCVCANARGTFFRVGLLGAGIYHDHFAISGRGGRSYFWRISAGGGQTYHLAISGEFLALGGGRDHAAISGKTYHLAISGKSTPP